LACPDAENEAILSFGRTVIVDVNLRDKLQCLAEIFE